MSEETEAIDMKEYKCPICRVTTRQTEDATATENFDRHLELMHVDRGFGKLPQRQPKKTEQGGHDERRD